MTCRHEKTHKYSGNVSGNSGVTPMKLLQFSGGFCTAFLILFVLAAGCTSNPSQGGTVLPVSPPVTTIVLPSGTIVIPSVTAVSPGTSTCGFTTCHGPDLACGPNPPQVCTALYQLGDKCRQFASCSNANNSCRLVTTPQYDSCRACVQKCGGADPAEIFGCEEKC
jgi:hypothetical protein